MAIKGAVKGGYALSDATAIVHSRAALQMEGQKWEREMTSHIHL